MPIEPQRIRVRGTIPNPAKHQVQIKLIKSPLERNSFSYFPASPFRESPVHHAAIASLLPVFELLWVNREFVPNLKCALGIATKLGEGHLLFFIVSSKPRVRSGSYHTWNGENLV